jgi:hypothetical protein
MRTLTRYLEVGGERILPNRRAEVLRDLDALKIRTAQLRVNVDVEGAEILVDGERIGRAPLRTSELVDAGAHRIVVQKQGYVVSSETITLVGADDKALDIHLVLVPVKDERPVIAGVYRNRLRKGMLLEADPTIQYMLEEGPRRLLYSDLKMDSPYNTYRHKGLPPGPVNNPGLASILAALYPAEHNYYFFVANGTGGHWFSTTFDEHKRMVRMARHRRALSQAARNQKQDLAKVQQ